MTKNNFIRLFGGLMCLIALVILTVIDWRIGVLVYLIIWGNNLARFTE